jgi:hypothetical protein
MTRKSLIQSLAALAMLTAGTAQCRECRGVSFPEQSQNGGTALTLNGLGMRQATFLKVNVYVAALYVPRASSDASALLGAPAPYELILHFVRNVDASDIDKGWIEGFERNNHAQLAALQERITTLSKWMTDVSAGQRLQFLFMPGAGLKVTVNGVMKGVISGDDFGKAFLQIWLGVPPNPEVKAGLLGGACG